MATIPNTTHTPSVTLDLGAANGVLYHTALDVRQVAMTKSVEESGESWAPRATASNNNFSWGH